MDFKKSIFENRMKSPTPFFAAHRGVCGANIPCNTMAAYKIAIDQGAEIVEIDITKSKDGEYFVFHPGMETVFLKSEKKIPEMTKEEVLKLCLLNQDDTPTSYKVPTLQEVLGFLKGKAYINVDKFWTDVEGISRQIRLAGVEDQVIVKTYTKEESLDEVAKYASDFMFMPMVSETDDVTDMLIKRGVNIIGTEVLFKTDDSPVISPEYIKAMHDKGLLIWANSIVYNEKANISAHHTDDISLTKSPELGWGWLIDRGVDIIQTDWLLCAKAYASSKIQG